MKSTIVVGLLFGAFQVPSGCSSSASKSVDRVDAAAGSAGTGGKDAAAGAGGDDASAGSGGSDAGGGTAGTGNDGGAGAPDGGAGAPDGGNLSCVQGVLTGTATASTEGASNRFTTSCGAGTAPDIAFQWTAPETDYYVFDTAGSTFDTVLAVLDGSCSGKELGCNNNIGAGPQSELVAKVSKGQRVIAVVDGQLGAKGTATVNVNRVTCPGVDVSGQPFPAKLTTVGGTNSHDGPCGGAGKTEKTLRWLAPAAGLYRFSVTSDAFEPALYVEQGPKCGGTLLQCNYGAKGGYPAQVTRRLSAGQVVTLTVDARSGTDGEFSINIEKLGVSCPDKPAITSDLTNVQLDDTSGAKTLSGSCSWAGNMVGSGHPYPEHAYPIHVQLSAPALCSYDIQTDGAYNLYLIRGKQCDGSEDRCLTPEPTSSLIFSAEDNGDYVLVIENPDPFGAPLTYSISTTCK